MPQSATFRAIAAQISAATGARCRPDPERAVGGGSINECYLWLSEAARMFVKVADQAQLPIYESEAAGLRELAGARAVRIPTVLVLGRTELSAFLALEWIDTGPTSGDSERKLGERLAVQHRSTAREFGWHRDNTIGRTPQPNAWMSDWVEFFRERRLRFQLDLAVRNGFGHLLAERGGRLLDAVGALLAGYAVQPSLLHGDLWGGNWLADAGGDPVIFDPAVYYGDREADLAMTRLFGGFGEQFYRAYEAAWPLAPGHAARFELYNLYHVLNHANLFGGGYARQARGMIDRLLAEVRG